MKKFPFLFYRILGPGLSREISGILQKRIDATKGLREDFMRTVPPFAEQLGRKVRA